MFFSPESFLETCMGPGKNGQSSVTELSKTGSQQREMGDVIKTRDETVFSQAREAGSEFSPDSKCVSQINPIIPD